ncbi:MAG: hypothetical protein GYB65_22745 [Chloroflexi bacterium]|nr:hypothetical protein [Chloroflexota bacterium]
MNESDHRQLADRLSKMTFKQARREIRRLDRAADMKFWRNSIWDEYHTLFMLPNEDITITLVEKVELEETDKRDFTGPPDRKQQDIEYTYVEARVAPLERPVKK